MPVTSARRSLLESMAHDEVVDHVATVAAQWGWLAFCPDRVKTSRDDHRTAFRHPTGKGFPDCCLAGMGWVLFVEVKTGKARLGAEQREWRELLLAVEDLEGSRVLHVVLRPSGIPQIEEFLRTGRREVLPV